MEGLGVERNEAKIRSEVHRPVARWREKCHVSSGRTWSCRSRELSLTGKWGESWLGNVNNRPARRRQGRGAVRADLVIVRNSQFSLKSIW